MGEPGRGSGKSARLPPRWPGFDSRARRHMWIEFAVDCRPCSEGFVQVIQFSSLHKNTSKFLFDLETVDEEPLRGNAIANSH